MRLITTLLAISLVLAQAAYAEDGAANEVLEYQTVKGKNFACDVGVLYKAVARGLEVSVAAMAVGRGSDFRRWEVTDIKLKTGGETLRPEKFDKFYGVKESVFRVPAAVVFAAIGSQYESYGSNCSESGSVCPVTGQPPGGGGHERSDLQKGIDKAGMAAGMGLLVSQAKGEITGLTADFVIAGETAAPPDAAQVVVENTQSHEKERLTVPLSEEAARLFREITAKHPGVEHAAGVPKGGDLILVTEEVTTAPAAQPAPPEEGRDLSPEKPEDEKKGPSYLKGQVLTEDDLEQQMSYSRSKIKLRKGSGE